MGLVGDGFVGVAVRGYTQELFRRESGRSTTNLSWIRNFSDLSTAINYL